MTMIFPWAPITRFASRKNAALSSALRNSWAALRVKTTSWVPVATGHALAEIGSDDPDGGYS